MCEGDGYTERELKGAIAALIRTTDRARIANGLGSIDRRYDYTAANLPDLRRRAAAVVEGIASKGDLYNMDISQLVEVISACVFFINTYKIECKSLQWWLDYRDIFKEVMLNIHERETESAHKQIEAINKRSEPTVRAADVPSCGSCKVGYYDPSGCATYRETKQCKFVTDAAICDSCDALREGNEPRNCKIFAKLNKCKFIEGLTEDTVDVKIREWVLNIGAIMIEINDCNYSPEVALKKLLEKLKAQHVDPPTSGITIVLRETTVKKKQFKFEQILVPKWERVD